MIDTRHTGQSYINKGFILMFFKSMVSTSATDLSGHLGCLLDRNLLTALHWDLFAVLFGNLLTVLNRLLNGDLIKGRWWCWWRNMLIKWDSPLNKILLGPAHTGSRASELGFADSSARELSYIAFHIHRIRHGQKNKPRNILQMKLEYLAF